MKKRLWNWYLLPGPLAALLLTVSLAAQTSTLTGRAITRDQSGERFAVPDVQITLTPVSEADPPPPAPEPVTTNAEGAFTFDGVPDGCYLATGDSAGLRGQSDAFCLPLPEGQGVTVELGLRIIAESVEVSSTTTAIGLAPTQTTSRGEVGVSTLNDAPKMNKRYEDVMPLIPGVFKGPSGEMQLNGTRASQSGSQFNGVDVTDPVSGFSPFAVPLEAVSNVEVLSSPYDTQYGGFAGAMSRVETKPPDMSDFKVALQNFGPRWRRRDGDIVGVESFTPRLTLTGPIKKGKIAFLQSTEYHFERLPQDDANLPPLERDRQRESLTLFNQIEIRHTERNSSSVSLLIYPAKLNFYGLNAFNLQESTPDLRRRGWLATYRNRHDFQRGATLLSQFSFQSLDKDVKPRGYEPYEVGLEKATGSFFNREGRGSERWGLNEQYGFAPRDGRGTHLLRTGFQFAHESYSGTQEFNPITWLGIAETPVRQTVFGPPADLKASKQDYAGFLQDKWLLGDKLTLDLGVRLERDTIASQTNPSFRTGFAYSLGMDARTVVRGGIGLFIHRAGLMVATFPNLPTRTEIRFDATGAAVSEQLFENRIGGKLRNPRSLSWNLQLDRELTAKLFLRLGYQQRRSTDNFIVDREEGQPFPGSQPRNFFTLRSAGEDHYREWQATLRYRLPKNGHVSASYVRSSAVGDLNALGSIYGPTAAELIRENQRAPLGFDATDRFVTWTEFGLPFGVRAVPVLELRTGFPYSVVDEQRDYAWAANRAGRFPVYKRLDLQVTKVFAFTIKGKRRTVRVGVRMFNLLNSYNPQDFQNNLASPMFGTYYRGVRREVRGVLGLGN